MSLDQGRRSIERNQVETNWSSVGLGERTASDTSASVAQMMLPLVAHFFADGLPVRFVFWDHSALGPEEGPGSVVLRSSAALTRLLWSPDELGMARAFVTGDLEVEGELFPVLAALHGAMTRARGFSPFALLAGATAAARAGAVRRPPPRPKEELRLSGWRHSRKRDAAAIAHHYDVGNDFYRLVLGPSMTYSCARFEQPSASLEAAQRSKHDLICRKLGLHERRHARLLDIGCGWGQMAMHAAAEYESHVVAVTLSEAQAVAARERVKKAGLEDLVEIRQADYRDLGGEVFDAISSIGMFEHVGAAHMDEYFNTIRALLEPHGRLLNHAISSPGGSKMQGRTFMNRYVFPDGELIDVAGVLGAMERAGFEVRDLESLREHYSETLHRWVDNLEQHWEEAVALVGDTRARVWRLYMAASANGFDDGGIAVHQLLGVVPGRDGTSAMPRTRSAWSVPAS
jgi:cyclopropane-fatty-acyl-phospholipid synthase